MRHLHLTDFNESERADYLVVVASMAGSHGNLSSEEVLALRQLCMHFVLGPDARGRVMAAVSTPPHDLDRIIQHLSHTDLKFSLILDLSAMAWHDGHMGPEDEKEIHNISRQLGIKEESVKVLLQFASKLLKGQHPDLEGEYKKLEAAGVSRGAVAISAMMLTVQVATAGAR
ncbi:MAG: hypothetical protein ACYCW6_17980 [Candidatus Xenobia bacterium]